MCGWDSPGWPGTCYVAQPGPTTCDPPNWPPGLFSFVENTLPLLKISQASRSDISCVWWAHNKICYTFIDAIEVGKAQVTLSLQL
jgi:hypothetical protein